MDTLDQLRLPAAIAANDVDLVAGWSPVGGPMVARQMMIATTHTPDGARCFPRVLERSVDNLAPVY